MRITYDATYITRGKSGVPRDAKSLAKILSIISREELRLVFFLKDSFPRKSKTLSSDRKHFNLVRRTIGSAIRINKGGRSVIPAPVERILLFFSSYTLFGKINVATVDATTSANILRNLSLETLTEPKISIANLDYKARLARPSKFKPHKIVGIESDIFIQQQPDPIQLVGNALQIVRIHDILPFTHPFYFDAMSVHVFNSSLKKMLKLNVHWVFDSAANAEEFKNLFAPQGMVTWIPPEVSLDGSFDPKLVKEKIVLVVNTLEPRKKVNLAVDGFLRGKRNGTLDSEWKLVIAGSNGWLQDDLYNALKKNKINEDISYVDSPTDEMLVELYMRAALVLSVTAAEGFGLPPLEGMLFGCEAVVSDIPQHREHVGNYGVFINGNSTEAVCQALGEAIGNWNKRGGFGSAVNADYVKRNFGETITVDRWKALLTKLIDVRDTK